MLVCREFRNLRRQQRPSQVVASQKVAVAAVEDTVAAVDDTVAAVEDTVVLEAGQIVARTSVVVVAGFAVHQMDLLRTGLQRHLERGQALQKGLVQTLVVPELAHHMEPVHHTELVVLKHHRGLQE
jgi:hypothetical protein